MVEKLIFDDGVKRIDINGNGLLCFNPSDLNVYQRLCALLQELPAMEERYKIHVEEPEDGMEAKEVLPLVGAALDHAKKIDAELKKKLAWVFGTANDFDKLLGGVNLMSPAGNGERVITNFLNAITPYIEEGARKHAKDAAAEAVAEAKRERARRSGCR